MSIDFYSHFKVTKEDVSKLWDIFNEYGMTKGEAPHRSKGNHYFLQAICQYHSVEWKTWNKELTPFVRDYIKENYPQFMVQNKDYEINNN